MINKIAFLYPKSFLWEYTNNLALKNIATKFGYDYLPIAYESDRFIDQLSQDNSVKLFFSDQNPAFYIDTYEKLKGKYPYAKFIMFGSDTVYYKGIDSCYWPVDLFLDIVQSDVEKATKYKAEHYYWTISETLIQQIEKTPLDQTKTTDFISLCRQSHSRRGFFNEILTAHSFLFNLNLWDLEQIFKTYAQCWFAIGHTTPLDCFFERGMKGFRDWIAPFCGTVLVYDDYPDMVKIGTAILPIYKYRDPNDLYRITDELKNDKTKYESVLTKQKEWCKINTIEAQLERILIKHGML